ncbi:MAG: hypothetical protein ACK5LK_04270 [Chthoniobacterales bacterium]
MSQNLFNFTYDPTSGLLAQMSNGNNTTTYSYHLATGDFRLKDLSTAYASGEYELKNITYDSVDNITGYGQKFGNP